VGFFDPRATSEMGRKLHIPLHASFAALSKITETIFVLAQLPNSIKFRLGAAL